ncbi:MAG: hypothetical protein NC043_08190 [Muribaculaceae bacterium]|nr:hypothetical protein [Muribaculaceae bacterium]
MMTITDANSKAMGVLKRVVIAVVLLAASVPRAGAQMQPGQVDIFAGVDFNYRDIFFNGRVFDLLVYVTPGVKWNMGHRWETSAQVLIPIINQYGNKDLSRVRLNLLSLSKQLSVGQRLRLKLSGGVFTANRYGIDAKGMLIVRDWLAFIGEAGLTGYYNMGSKWTASSMERITWQAGADFWLKKWNTQMLLKGGRFIYADYGVMAEAWRHFRHVSVGVWGGYTNLEKKNAGFRVIVMLPPYKRTRRRVNFRPASNFRITYSSYATAFFMREYNTDPEQNERSGWFDRDMLPWGPDTMEPDFIYKEKDADKRHTEASADSIKAAEPAGEAAVQ